MSENGKVYSFLDYLLIIAGVPLTQIGGFAEGDAFEIEQVSDSVNATEGADGTVAFSYTGARLFTLKVKLLSTSSCNAAMTAIYETQQATRGSFPVAAKDLKGVDAFVAGTCVINKPPKMTQGNKVATREWSLLCADGKLFLGGN